MSYLYKKRRICEPTIHTLAYGFGYSILEVNVHWEEGSYTRTKSVEVRGHFATKSTAREAGMAAAKQFIDNL